MREIKLRAWEPTKKVMHYFDLNKAANDIYIAEHLFELMANTHSLGKDLLTQYSGLKDKNGVEIYEGDVVHLAGYGDYIAKFPFIDLYEAGFESDIGAIKGNIYENPEYND